MKPVQGLIRNAALCLIAMLAMVGSSAHAQTVEYIHTDALGTPVAVTDASGNVIERSEYAPYGELLNRPVSDGPGFTGHVGDAATGLVYMQQRYYDPTIPRFLSVDPITVDTATGGNFNRYWYANNNPYRFNDPDGRQSVEGFVDFWSGVAKGVGDGFAMTAQIGAPGGPSVYGTVDTSSFRSVQPQPVFGPPTSQVGLGGYKFGSALFVSAGIRGFFSRGGWFSIGRES